MLTYLERLPLLRDTLMQMCNLVISSSSDNMPKVSHYNPIYFLNYTHLRYMICLFTSIQKQYNTLKAAYFLRKIHILRVNNSTILSMRNAKFSGYCFHVNPNYSEIFKSALVCLYVSWWPFYWKFEKFVSPLSQDLSTLNLARCWLWEGG